MSEQPSHEAFALALLSQERRLDDEHYAAHRRRLDQRLTESLSPAFPFVNRSRQRLQRLASVAAIIVVCFLGVAFQRPLSKKPEPSPTSVVLEKFNTPVNPDGLLIGPYERTVYSSCVALVRLGERVRKNAADLYPLQIEHVLKDESGVKWPAFSCLLDTDNPKPRKGRDYLVFLDRSKDREWFLTEILPLDESLRQEVLPGVLRCVELLEIAKGNNPRPDYERLLAPEGKGLDAPAHCVFTCQPDPRSSDVLLAHFCTLHQQLTQPAPFSPNVKELRPRLLRFAEVFARLKEARAAIPVTECTRRFAPGERGKFYLLLPDLCLKADESTRAHVRRLLWDEIEKGDSDGSDYACAREADKRIDNRRSSTR